MATLTPQQRMRRVAILCGHCLRNIAYYKAGWRDGHPRTNRSFWTNANSNALDIAVLEWCKLFADRSGKHHWRKVVTDKTAFKNGLLQTLGMTEVQYKSYKDDKVTHYRDKFIAHLDDEPMAIIPMLDAMHKSTVYLYDHLKGEVIGQQCLNTFPAAASDHYDVMLDIADREYRYLEQRDANT